MTQTQLIDPGAATARRAALRPVLALIGGFVAVSALMLVALAVLVAAGNDVDVAVWVRCSIVLGSSLVLLAIAASAARGSRAALTRLRIISPIVLAAIVVIVSIPGFLPVWVRLEQGLCGLILVPVVVLVNLPRTRIHFPRQA
jgi:hypothetical protein